MSLENKTNAEQKAKTQEICVEGYPDLYCSLRFLEVLIDLIEIGYPFPDINFLDKNKDKLRPEHYAVLRRLPTIAPKPTGKLYVSGKVEKRLPRRHAIPPIDY